MVVGGMGARYRARAKINLHLHVVGRRADGFHLLDSLAVFADLGDELRVAEARDLRLTVDGPFAPALEGESDNLVLRAARALAAHVGHPPAAAIHLTKNLPIASGIGGGSSDAATILIALSRLWRLDLGLPILSEIGLTLGADLPICLAAGPRLMGGIGEVLSDSPKLPAAALLLVNPGIAVPTPAVFKARVGAFSAPMRWPATIADAKALAIILKSAANDLTQPAIAVAPVVGEVLQAIETLPECLLARLSGSGGTCFGLFAMPGQAAKAAELLSALRPSWWVRAAPMLAQDRDPAA